PSLWQHSGNSQVLSSYRVQFMRVVEGTDITVHVKNDLPERLDIHGFVTRPATNDSVLSIPAGEEREIRFSAGVPGTYYYWATTAGSTLNNRRALESELGGALTLVMHRLPAHWHPEDAYGFALRAKERDPQPEDATVPGPLLVLTRNEPVAIT